MKGKGAASLYEVLKTASRPGGEAAGAAPAPAPASAPDAAPQPTLQERLAAYKAQKLAAATTAPASAPEPSPSPIAEAPAVAVAEATPPPAPPPAPAPVQTPPAPVLVEAGPADGPGERVLRLTYNTIAFAGLVGVGLLFVAYAVGVQSGRRRAAAEAVETPASARPALAALPDPSPPPPPPPPPPRIHTVWLAEWKYGVASERLKAEDAVRRLKDAMSRAGLKGAQTMKVKRGAETRLALHIDQVTDTASAAARARLETLRKFRFGTQAPFAQASYVEMPE